VQTVLAFNGLSRDDFATISFWRMNITYFVIALWIWDIIIWSKKDKKVSHFLGLFFLNGLYTLYYYRLVLKNNWLETENDK
jgi:hypothetical protein